MIFKKIVILSLIMLICRNVFAQHNSNFNFFKNDSLKYDIVWKPRLIPSKAETTGYFVKMDLPKKYRKKILKKDFEFWKGKLESDTTDFATNVLLYYIYKREASSIFILKTKKEYLPYIKNNEIKYWKDFFNGKRKNN